MPNGKSAPSVSPSSSSSAPAKDGNNIKNAANLLLKGGTLLSNPCDNCKGVQIRFKENIVCVNCGREVKEINTTQIEEEKIKEEKNVTSNHDQSGISNKENILIQSTSNYNNEESSNDIKDSGEDRESSQFLNFKKIIAKKITVILNSLENENDVLSQNSKLELISKYLDVLNKIKSIDKEI